MSDLLFATAAADSVRSFHNGRSLSAIFKSAIALSQDPGELTIEKQAGLSILCGITDIAEFNSFSTLYAVSLQRLGLAPAAHITFTPWAELLPDAEKEETVESIAPKLAKIFAENTTGLIVITKAYEAKAVTEDDKLAISTLEDALRAHMKAHPLVVLQGNPAHLKKNLGSKGQKLAFGQKIGL